MLAISILALLFAIIYTQVKGDAKPQVAKGDDDDE